MKKAYFLLIIMVISTFILGCSNNASLRQQIKYGNKISKKIQTLYKEKSIELSSNADQFIEWRKQFSDTPTNNTYTIERNKEGKWQYYTDDYVRIPIEWEDKALEKMISTLFDDYELKRIIINENDIRYYISEDALIYSINIIEIDELTVHIEDNWYHFKFPYGI